MGVPTSGWTNRNSVVRNDYLVPDRIGAQILDAAASQWRFLTQSLGGNALYTLIATVRCQPYEDVSNSANHASGFMLYDGTKVETFYTFQSRLAVRTAATIATSGSDVAGPTINLTPKLFTAKIVKDASNRTFYYWSAGAWVQFYQEAASTFLTETDIGFGGVSGFNVTQAENYVELLDWSLTLGAARARSFAAVIG
jgi:hypothetical protein